MRKGCNRECRIITLQVKIRGLILLILGRCIIIEGIRVWNLTRVSALASTNGKAVGHTVIWFHLSWMEHPFGLTKLVDRNINKKLIAKMFG